MFTATCRNADNLRYYTESLNWVCLPFVINVRAPASFPGLPHRLSIECSTFASRTPDPPSENYHGGHQTGPDLTLILNPNRHELNNPNRKPKPITLKVYSHQRN